MARKDANQSVADSAKATAQDVKDALPAREQLPTELQKLVDDEESLFDQLYDGSASPTTDSNLRYAAYASRFRTILLAAHRYVAYTSDVGESFRPIAHPWLIKGAYGVSWAYLLGDVSHEGYKAYLQNRRVRDPGREPGVPASAATDATAAVQQQKGLLGGGVGLRHWGTKKGLEGEGEGEVGQGGEKGGGGSGEGGEKRATTTVVPWIEDYRAVMAERAVFQGVASMGLPAFTIHSIVRYSGRALKDVKNVRLRMYGPIGLGLAAVPFLPFVFDKPVEEVVGWSFHKAFETLGGPEAVRHSPGFVHERLEEVEGREKEL